jgi:hypothetical protein
MFVVGCAAAIFAAVAAVSLELSVKTEWVYQYTRDQEFVRPLPTEKEIIAQSKHLPKNASRFRYSVSNADLLGLTTTRTYVGYFDPACQKPVDDTRRACAKIGYPLFSNGSELRCAEVFSLEPKAPADQCVLWAYSDHYLAPVTTTYWKLGRLFGSAWFVTPFGLAIVSMLNLLLMRSLWLPIWRWIFG